MLLADVHTIRDVVLFPTLRPEVLGDTETAEAAEAAGEHAPDDPPVG